MELNCFPIMGRKIYLMITRIFHNFIIEKIIVCLIPFSAIFSIFILDFSLLVLSISFITRCFKEKNYSFFINKFSFFFSIFYLYIFIRYIFRDTDYNSFNSVFFYFRYGLYVISIYFFLSKIKNLEKMFLNSVLCAITIIVIDSIIQYLFGHNILGYQIIDNNRLSSFFGEESILGSFLLKFLPFIYLIASQSLKNKSKLVFTMLLIAISDVIIFLSGERASFIMMVFLTIYFIFMFKNLRFLRTILITFTSIIIIYIFLNSENVSQRYLKTLDEFSKSENYTNNQILDKKLINTKFYIISPTHHNYFLTSINMFKDNKIFGQGPRSFRYLCDKDKYKINIYSCSTHPHNYYIQVLAELGLIGFIFLLVFYLYICRKIFLIILYSNKKDNSYLICILAFFLINLWPITSTGNFFNNWLSILIYMPFSFLLLKEKNHDN